LYFNAVVLFCGRCPTIGYILHGSNVITFL